MKVDMIFITCLLFLASKEDEINEIPNKSLNISKVKDTQKHQDVGFNLQFR